MVEDLVTWEETGRDENFIYGIRRRFENGQLAFTTETFQITDEAHLRVFWFLRPPHEYLNEKGYVVSKENAGYLQKIFSEDWPGGARYFMDSCDYTFDVRHLADEVAKIIINDVMTIANEIEIDDPRVLVSVGKVNWLANRIFVEKTLDKKYVRDILRRWLAGEGRFTSIAGDSRYAPVSGSDVDDAIRSVLDANMDRYDGSDKIVNWLTGQVMKSLGGKAPAAEVKEKIRRMGDDRRASQG